MATFLGQKALTPLWVALGMGTPLGAQLPDGRSKNDGRTLAGSNVIDYDCVAHELCAGTFVGMIANPDGSIRFGKSVRQLIGSVRNGVDLDEPPATTPAHQRISS